jgi:hypothetical protein
MSDSDSNGSVFTATNAEESSESGSFSNDSQNEEDDREEASGEDGVLDENPRGR